MDEENRPKEAAHGRKVLKVEGLSKTYGKTVAVDSISFQVFEGEIFGMVGPNGPGKTRDRDSARLSSRRNSDRAKIFRWEWTKLISFKCAGSIT